MERGPQLRRCVACGARAINAYGKVGHYNCVTGAIAKGNGRPSECWIIRHPTLAEPFLAALHPVKAQGKPTNDFFDRKITFAREVMVLEQQNKLTAETLKPLVEAFGRANTGKFIGSLPGDHPIKLKLTAVFRRTRPPKPSKLPKNPRPPVEIIELPPEFEKAIAIWSDISHRRAARHIKNGNTYEVRTASRRVQDARRFLEFLVKNGVTSWANVSQIHLDEFTVSHPRRLAQKAFSFWRAIRGHFPMLAKLVGPRREKPVPITERTVSDEQYKSILKFAEQCNDQEITLCIYLVLVYAQTIVKATEITVGQIRCTESKYQIRFNEIWVPLDPMTQSALERRLSEIKQANWGQELNPETKLFSSSPQHLSNDIRLATGIHARKMRLTAIRRILLSGYTDRKGIELSLGVTMQTIRFLERSCSWALQDYVTEEARELRKDLLNGKLS